MKNKLKTVITLITVSASILHGSTMEREPEKPAESGFTTQTITSVVGNNPKTLKLNCEGYEVNLSFCLLSGDEIEFSPMQNGIAQNALRFYPNLTLRGLLKILLSNSCYTAALDTRPVSLEELVRKIPETLGTCRPRFTLVAHNFPVVVSPESLIVVTTEIDRKEYKKRVRQKNIEPNQYSFTSKDATTEDFERTTADPFWLLLIPDNLSDLSEIQIPTTIHPKEITVEKRTIVIGRTGGAGRKPTQYSQTTLTILAAYTQEDADLLRKQFLEASLLFFPPE